MWAKPDPVPSKRTFVRTDVLEIGMRYLSGEDCSVRSSSHRDEIGKAGIGAHIRAQSKVKVHYEG